MRTIFLSRIVVAALLLGFGFGCSPEARKSRHIKRAENYFKSGEYNKAKIEYLGVLRLDPKNEIAFERLGFIWSEQGAPLRAAPFLFKARELAPNNPDNRVRLGRVLLSLGDASAARKEATETLAAFPNHDEAILLLSETDRTTQDIAYTEEQLKKFPDQNRSSYYLAQANVEFRKGQLPAAKEALQHAEQLDPKSSTPHLAFAALLLLTKDFAGATKEFRKAAELSPARSIAHVRLAEFKMQTGAVEEAKQILKQVTAKTPDLLPAWLLLGRIALAEKHYDETNSMLENVFSQDPDNIDARILQAEVLSGRGETQKATETLERLSKTYPSIPGIKYQLALSYLQQNNLPQAGDALKQAIAANPEYSEAILLLAQVNLRTGNAQAVVPAMTELLKKRPNFGPARLVLAEAHQMLGQLDEAISTLHEQVSNAPRDFQSHFFLGLVLRQQNKSDEARAAFEKARELAPDNPSPVDQLIELDIASKDFKNATSKAQEEVRKTPNSAAAHYMEGKVYAATHSWDQAETALSKALELDANFSRAYDGLISVYVARGKLPEATNRLEALIAKNPKNPSALLMSAMLYEQMKEFEKARLAYEKVLAAYPDFVSALNNLAYLYATHFKQVDKALELANKARQLKPEDPSIADTLGWISYKKGDYQRALSLLQQAASKLSDNPEVQFHLGMANYMMGQMEPARQALERAANSPTDFPGKEDCKRRLALLQESGATNSNAISIPEMQSLLAQEPNDPITLQRIGESYEKEGKFPEAAESYERVIKLNPNLVAPTLKLAQLNAGPLKNANKAMTLAKQARELAPNDPKVNALLGAVAYEVGNFEWAYSLLQESARRMPDNIDALRHYAWAAYSLGKISEARRAMESVLKTTHDAREAEDAKSFLSLTPSEQTSPDSEALSAEAEKILQAQPDYVPALMVQAQAARQRHDDKTATEIYNKILQRYPDFSPAQKDLARVYANDSASLNNAYELAVKAHKKLPDDVDLTQTLAEISYKRKDFNYTLQLLNENGRKKPLDAQALFYLGMSSSQLKQNTQARDALQRALGAGLSEPFATEAKQTLTQLR
jgi:tetratricopeptide (TPR) repeat protein